MNQQPPIPASVPIMETASPPERSGRRFSGLAGSAAQNQSPPGAAIAGDILYGADAIAMFLFGERKHRRRVYNLVSTNGLPVFRIGVNICARKSVLLGWIADQESVRCLTKRCADNQ